MTNRCKSADELRQEVTEATGRALAQCDREGIPREDFYAAIQKEKKSYPDETLEQVFDRIFEKLRLRNN